jgi:hypothetical protein
VARFCLWSAVGILPVRLTVLRLAAGIRPGLGGSGRRGLLAHGTRLAATRPDCGTPRRRPTEYQHSRAARGSEVRVPSWPGRRISAGVRVSLFSGPVRDGLERPQLHGWSGLCGPEDCSTFAVAGDRRLHHGGYVCHRRPLETSCVDGAGARYPGCWPGSGQSGLCAA